MKSFPCERAVPLMRRYWRLEVESITPFKATRQATALQLDRSGSKRLNNMLRFGVTTVEVKSGYGLDLENELKLLRVIRGLNDHPIDCVSTCLHCPMWFREFQGNKAAYLKLIINDLPTLKFEGFVRVCGYFRGEQCVFRQGCRSSFLKHRQNMVWYPRFMQDILISRLSRASCRLRCRKRRPFGIYLARGHSGFIRKHNGSCLAPNV